MPVAGAFGKLRFPGVISAAADFGPKRMHDAPSISPDRAARGVSITPSRQPGHLVSVSGTTLGSASAHRHLECIIEHRVAEWSVAARWRRPHGHWTMARKASHLLMSKQQNETTIV